MWYDDECCTEKDSAADCGLERQEGFQLLSNMTTYELLWTSVNGWGMWLTFQIQPMREVFLPLVGSRELS